MKKYKVGDVVVSELGVSNLTIGRSYTVVEHDPSIVESLTIEISIINDKGMQWPYPPGIFIPLSESRKGKLNEILKSNEL